MERSRGHHLPTLLLASLALVGLLAAACGSGDDDAEEPASEQDATAPGETDTGVGTDVTIAPDGAPTPGGTLVYGLDAETDGWDPVDNRWSPPGTIVGLTIYDPLAAYDADSVAQPYLAESFSHDETYTSWEITLRAGVQFHDSTPLTAQAVADVFERHLQSGLTRPALAALERVEVVDELTARFVMTTSWASFPSTLTGQLGMVPAPSSTATAPVGTGPFVFEDWRTGDRLTVTRNDTYWQRDETGNPLPYLDGVEFRPLTDEQTRVTALETGEIDMLHTTDSLPIRRLEDLAEAGDAQLVWDRSEAEERFLLLNTAAPPFDDPVARQAVAHATDREAYNDVLYDGVPTVADSVFTPGTKYYSDTAFPAYDPDEARRLVEEYEATNGEPLAFSISITPDVSDNAQFLQQAFAAVGMDVTIDQKEEVNEILDVLSGNFQSDLWRQFGSPDPDFDYVWWISDNATDVGTLGLNIARLRDDQVDEALNTARATQDEAVRKDAYADLQQRFNELLPFIWLNHTTWVIGAGPEVRGITNGPLPDGSPSLPVGGPGGFGSVTRLTATWIQS
ncbi:MAG: ABC transporter substrate-binding protein [Acidimicrobiales bacterium]|jgi:ABC-type transport system substrate-binding protein|nr:ABC transporter substrate-binding protein [Acidimicrobiales bacterium]